MEADIAVEGARLPDGAFCARENVLSWTQALWDSFGETDDNVTSIIEDVGDAYDKLFEWQRGDDESEDSAWSESSGRLIMTVKTTEHTLEHMRTRHTSPTTRPLINAAAWEQVACKC